MSQSNLWRFLGLSLSFLMHAAACNSFKLYALFAALVVAVTPYALLEYRLDARRRSKATL